MAEINSIKQDFGSFVRALQNKICCKLEEVDGEAEFLEDSWDREGGGGGLTRVLERGGVFEKAGVNISEVYGELPDLIRNRFKVEQGWFYATGISLVIHPESPMIPTVHANFRYFELYEHEGGEVKDAWFGGGADLTPYYIWDNDAIHFHQILKNCCNNFDEGLYPVYKKQCDQYFYNTHRKEGRGVGGIFFDYLRDEPGKTMHYWYDLVISLGESFLPAYIPIVERRKEEEWNDSHRYFQEIRRGRYVEFNLIHDRGTLFGLKTGGRTESILMSLPPRTRWDYNYEPVKGSREAYTLDILANPREW